MRIAIVGGGVYAPRLCEALASALAPRPVDIRLAARRRERLRVVELQARADLERAGAEGRVRACGSVAEACRGAGDVVLLVRVGGLEARAHDEAFPARHGLVGDEGLGAGGLANAWRSVPVLRGIAREMRRAAPQARVWNLMAPLGVTTRLLVEEGLRAVGVCELPIVTRERLEAAAGLTSHAGDLGYAGLNHLGWFWPRSERGAQVLKRASARGLVDARVLAQFGAAPLHYYYEVFDPPAARRLGRQRPSGRAHWLADLDRHAAQRFAREPGARVARLEQRPTPWFDRALVPMLAACVAGTPWEGTADVPNGSSLPFPPREGVVELPVRIRDGLLTAHPDDEMPDAVAAFLERMLQAEECAYRAACDHDRAALARALALLPRPPAPSRIPALVHDICCSPGAAPEAPA